VISLVTQMVGTLTHFFRVEVLERSGNMFGEREAVETFRYSGLDNLFERVLGMATELARMAVVGVRHVRVHSTGGTACAVQRDLV
jgi:hypothetical protein